MHDTFDQIPTISITQTKLQKSVFIKRFKSKKHAFIEFEDKRESKSYSKILHQ